MVKSVINPLRKRKKTKENSGQHTIRVVLERESVEHLKRLKTKFAPLSDDALIALALKYLDQKTDRIIKRRVLRRVRAQEKKGQEKSKRGMK